MVLGSNLSSGVPARLNIVSLWLYIAARREIKRLEQVSTDIRIEEAEAQCQRKAPRPR